MPKNDRRSGFDRRTDQDRRRGVDTRSDEEKRLIGERRSKPDRRSKSDRRMNPATCSIAAIEAGESLLIETPTPFFARRGSNSRKGTSTIAILAIA